MKKISTEPAWSCGGGPLAPDYALGSVHAVTCDGTLLIASASGSQLASYAWVRPT
jgi:hypothetical protein